MHEAIISDDEHESEPTKVNTLFIYINIVNSVTNLQICMYIDDTQHEPSFKDIHISKKKDIALVNLYITLVATIEHAGY